MTPISVLDLAPVCEGSDTTHAFANMLDLAQHAERWGYQRYWLAEHHNMPGIASAATAVLIGHVAGGTKTIRVGAGGIMLPNHAPLQVAEQFGTLASLYPQRIDLGLGRAPGTDQPTARALRRYFDSADHFPQDVAELMRYFAPAVPGQLVQAVPGAGLEVPVWLLGSSLFSARLAAAMGLSFAFASHFAPDAMDEAVAIYRREFRPSAQLAKPHVMLALNVVAARRMRRRSVCSPPSSKASSICVAASRARSRRPSTISAASGSRMSVPAWSVHWPARCLAMPSRLRAAWPSSSSATRPTSCCSPPTSTTTPRVCAPSKSPLPRAASWT